MSSLTNLAIAWNNFILHEDVYDFVLYLYENNRKWFDERGGDESRAIYVFITALWKIGIDLNDK